MRYFRRIYVLIIILTTSSFQVYSNTYYFSTSEGNDSNTSFQAQNIQTPWKSIQKLNSIMATLQPGDQILFKRGEIFPGNILFSASGTNSLPILLSAYGNGKKPVINATISISAWTNTGTNIWVASLPVSVTNKITGLYYNGQDIPIGRWPNVSQSNKGYIAITSHAGTTQLTSNQLSSAPTLDWKDGEVVYRAARWILNRSKITSQTGNSLNLAASVSYGLSDGWGFFIQDHPSTLDLNKEWYCDIANHKLMMYLNNEDPKLQKIEVPLFSSCITIQDQNHITIDNLTLYGALNTNLNVINSTFITFQNCQSINAGINSLVFTDGNHISITNDTILQTHNNAINIQSIDKVLCRNNLIKNTGIIAGMGNSGDGQYIALNVAGYGSGPSDSLIIENNAADSIGYLGIGIYGYNNVLIKNNFIQHYDLTKDDGGGIYFYTGLTNNTNYINRKIVGNIVLNAIGAPEGTDNLSYAPAEGIYLDDNSSNIEISGNSIAHCANNGIFLHNSHEVSMSQNTVYDSNRQLLIVNDNQSAGLIRNLKVFDNILFSKNRYQWVTDFQTTANDIISFGSFDSNYYCRPFDDLYVMKTATSMLSTVYSLNEWQKVYGLDAHSHTSPIEIIPYFLKTVLGTNLFTNESFTNNVNGLYCFTSLSDCSTNLDNSGILDGGSLKLVPGKSSNTLLVAGVGSVNVAKDYVLKFSLKGSRSNNKIKLFLRQSVGQYSNLTPIQYCKIDTLRTENQFFFTSPTSEVNASIVFEIDATDSTLWIDNLRFYQADISIANPEDSIRFEYNATPFSKTIPLVDTYIDVKKKEYSLHLDLAPFSSVILIKSKISKVIDQKPDSVKIDTIKADTVKVLKTSIIDPYFDDILIYPNPTIENFEIQWPIVKYSGKLKLEIFDMTANVKVVKEFRSEDGKLEMSTSSFAPGMYFIKISFDKSSAFVKKLTIY